MTSISRLLAVLVAVAWAAVACAGDDEVSTSGTVEPAGGDDPGAEVTVVVDGGEFDRLTYTVTCGAGGATVQPDTPGVDPDESCARLADPGVVALLVEGPPADRLCTEIYGGPQAATITGRVGGQAVEARVTRVNGCEIDTWDRLLAGLLPPTQGVDGQG